MDGSESGLGLVSSRLFEQTLIVHGGCQFALYWMLLWWFSVLLFCSDYVYSLVYPFILVPSEIQMRRTKALECSFVVFFVQSHRLSLV